MDKAPEPQPGLTPLDPDVLLATLSPAPARTPVGRPGSDVEQTRQSPELNPEFNPTASPPRLPTRPVFGSWRPIAWVLAALLGACWAGIAKGSPPQPHPYVLLLVLAACAIACAIDARVDARMSHAKKQLLRQGKPVPGPAYDYLPPGGRIIFSGGVLFLYSLVAMGVVYATS